MSGGLLRHFPLPGSLGGIPLPIRVLISSLHPRETSPPMHWGMTLAYNPNRTNVEDTTRDWGQRAMHSPTCIMPSVWFVFLEVVWLSFFVPYQSDNPINSGSVILRGVSASP